MILTQTYSVGFKNLISSPFSLINGFRFQFGRKTSPNYNDDFKSIIYESETIVNLFEGKPQILITVNVLESLVGKNYKVIYLLYDDLLSNTINNLAGEISIDSSGTLLISKNKNFILLDFSVTVEGIIIPIGSEYIKHLQSNNISKINNSNISNELPLDRRSFTKVLLDKKSSNTSYLWDTTLNNTGLKNN